MGVVISFELGRCADLRLRVALRCLAAFGVLHGLHEWLEMFYNLGAFARLTSAPLLWNSLHLSVLAISFLPLSCFGISLLAFQPRFHRLTWLVPLCQTGVWLAGLPILHVAYPINQLFWSVLDVWTRYSLAIPSALLASAGLVYQQREFRRAGMARFGQGSLWVSIAFAWYGLVGQLFTEPSVMPPSNVVNTTLFLQVFGFPVQLLRTAAAVVAAVFVIRFLRSFEVETQHKIDELQNDYARSTRSRPRRRWEQQAYWLARVPRLWRLT